MMLKAILMRLDVWITQIQLNISALLRDKSACCQLPTDLIHEIARCLLPAAVAFYETSEGRKEYEEWKHAQTQQTAQNTPQRS